ncbi:MAG: hypothetical protein EOP45_13120 [Sphingobacteriaceae bacterium]|nr:MAG: hypothetical protein EOP45_13120 [Sphingobacteriaceae bacterium]
MANTGDPGNEEEIKRLREEIKRLEEKSRKDEEQRQRNEERIKRLEKEKGYPYLLTSEHDEFGLLVRAWEVLWDQGKKEGHLYQDTLSKDGKKVSHLIKELSRTQRMLYKRDIYDEVWDALHSKYVVDTKAFIIWGQPGIGTLFFAGFLRGFR